MVNLCTGVYQITCIRWLSSFIFMKTLAGTWDHGIYQWSGFSSNFGMEKELMVGK